MDLLSQEVEISELKEGDHIYSWRKLYTHHGIFIGEDKVIHFMNYKREEGGGGGGNRFLAPFKMSSAASSNSGRKTPCLKSYCGNLEKVAKGGVKSSCIDCFIKQGSLNRYKYQANRVFLYAKTVGGTCTTAASDPPEEVIHRATYLYENGYPCKYDLMNNNCEDFALYCKTGLWSTDKGYQGRSSQANMIHSSSCEKSKKDKELGERLQQIATAIPRSFSKRDNKDLGSRKDLVKVPVEELSYFILSL